MFILRSSFWLLVGFLLIKPFAIEPDQASKALAQTAMHSAAELVVQHADLLDCTDIGCDIAKSVVVANAMASKPVATPAQFDELAAVPVPPARPNWAG